MAKPQRKQAETPIDGGRHLLEDTLAELRGQLGVISARRKELMPGSFDKDLAMAAAALGRTINSVVGELRKLEVHDRRVVTVEMTDEDRDEMIMNYISELTPERREVFIQALATVDASGPGILGHDVEPN